MLPLTINFWTSGANDSANSLPPIFPTYRERVKHMFIRETTLKGTEHNGELLMIGIKTNKKKIKK